MRFSITNDIHPTLIIKKYVLSLTTRPDLAQGNGGEIPPQPGPDPQAKAQFFYSQGEGQDRTILSRDMLMPFSHTDSQCASILEKNGAGPISSIILYPNQQ